MSYFPNLMQSLGRSMGGMGGMGDMGHYQQNAQYQDFLDVIPAYQSQKPELEGTAKILLPSDVLQNISQFQFPVPMLFCIINTSNNKKVYLGVQEFTAPRQTVVLPQQFYDQIGCYEGQKVGVSLICNYKKGNFVKIQPHETAFIDLPNPKAILEHELPQFVQFLSKDQTIEIKHMGKNYKINILEVKPDDQSHTICIVDTDLNIDFAPPLDYVEESVNPLRQITKRTSSQAEREEALSKKWLPFGGGGVRIDNKPINQKQLEQEQEKLRKKIQEKDFDPRKFKLKHGVRTDLNFNQFQGEGVKIGKSKR